jgi:hypothetical protein
MKVFNLDPASHAPAFADRGFVHIPGGLDEEYYATLAPQVEDFLRRGLMPEFAVGDKQQALYELPHGRGCYPELFETIGAICGLDPNAIVLSERHIKSYEPHAIPDPPAHKDRFASQISVGLSIRVPEGSALVLYPDDHLDVNPFNSSKELRTSLSPENLPETYLPDARRVEIHDKPGDVIVFRGHAIWHLRSRPAGTTMVYLKFNVFNCDPLGEDPSSVTRREETLRYLGLPDEELEGLIPLVGRRVDYVHRRYNRDWKEVIGVVLWGERDFAIDEAELRGLRAMDGRLPVWSVVERMGDGPSASGLEKVRRLAARGVIDLVAPSMQPGVEAPEHAQCQTS